MTLWISPLALSCAKLRTRPYHEEGSVRPYDGHRFLSTLCGCAIRWDDEPSVMVEVRPTVARLVGRPCKDCARIRARSR